MPVTKQWRIDQRVAWEMKSLGRAQLGGQEGAMLYYLARDWFSGSGTIVELGSFLGASASLLAKGINDNPNFEGGKLLHCFDIWEAKYGDMADFIQKRIEPNFPDGGDFINYFWEQVGENSHIVETHKGDFNSATWDGEPIDLLFVDIAKSPELNAVVLNQFVSALRVGGLMINQDFHIHQNPWVQVSMGPLLKYFSIYEARADTSAAFILEREIPIEALNDAARYDDLSVDEKLMRINQTIDAFRFEAYQERYLDLCLVRLLAEGNRFEEANSKLGAIYSRINPYYDKKTDWFWMEWFEEVRDLATTK